MNVQRRRSASLVVETFLPLSRSRKQSSAGSDRYSQWILESRFIKIHTMPTAASANFSFSLNENLVQPLKELVWRKHDLYGR
jgi:hypothetical protein